MTKIEPRLRSGWLRALRSGVLVVAASAFLGGLQASADEPEKAPASPPPPVVQPPQASAPPEGRTRGMPPAVSRVPDPDDLQRVPDPDDLDAKEPEAGDL